jgi:deazaflavin-dependent oxidoreductase (nitroreductase family)
MPEPRAVPAQETHAQETPQTQMLTSWSTTRPELNAGRFMKAFVIVNVYLYTRPPTKVSKSINRFFIRLNVYLYRRSHGRILGHFGDLDALLLTTMGRKSGKERTTPVGYQWDAGRFVVCAVPGHFDAPGAAKATHPLWYLNLQANPKAVIDIGREQLDVTSEVLSPGGERDQMWQRFTNVYPFIGEFQKRANRLIPIVVFTPTNEERN